MEDARDGAGVTTCQDPRMELSFTLFCSLRWPSPGHAVTCLAHKHVTICPKVYNLAKFGRAMPNPGTQW